MSTAYLLAREGRSVIVIDDGAVGSGETHHTTAHLSNALDDRYTELERMHGPEGAKLAAASHTAAIDCIRRIAAHEGIDCDFELLDGYLVVPPGASTDVLKREHDAARRCGVAASLVEDVPIDSYRFGQALRFPDQGQFHPLRYVNGLAVALERLGGHVYGGTHAKAIEGGKSPRVETALGVAITARAIGVATNTPVNDRVAIHIKQAPYRTYAIGARVRRGSLPHLLL
jgi:glycine/D-amino acid oxidase-like deaminating enzyme